MLSLKKKIPEIGNRIKFSSETEEPSNVDILNTESDSLGSWSKFFNTSNGEVYKAGLFISPEMTNYRKALTKKFENWSLSSDSKSDTEHFIDFVVFHELGHILGLRHNFIGWQVHNNSDIQLLSVMTYAMNILPFSFTTIRDVEYLEHDILSLKFLYADLISESEPELLRKQLLTKLNDFEFLTDEDTAPQLQMLDRILEFYKTSVRNELVNLREKMDAKEIMEQLLNDERD